MCGSENSRDCQCVRDIVKTIICLQKKESNECTFTGCDKPFLGPSPEVCCFNTRPISFYNCVTGRLWEIDATVDSNNCTSTVFRAESLDECCCTCRILIKQPNGCFTSTNQFFTIDLNCVSAIRCHPDTFIDLC